MSTEWLITYECMECSWNGTVLANAEKVKCSGCGTVNDWWKDGEEPPISHQIAQARNGKRGLRR